jgi:glycosyltransferase involved in cell wall biosynthesis
MRIAVDYTAAVRQGGGIGRYTREIVSAILAVDTPPDDRHRSVVMAAVAGLGARWEREAARLRALDAGGRLTLRPLPLTDDWLARIWQRLRVPIPAEWITGPVDLFYSPDFVLPPLRKRTPALLTVHDLSFLRHPETFPQALRDYLERAVPRSVERADHILADSHATRRDLIALLDVPPDKVTTLHLGVSPRFSPEADAGERVSLNERYPLGPKPYVLAVGTVQPRKNIRRLIAALDVLAPTHDVTLALAGQPAWLADPILEAAEARDDVRVLGFVDDADLPALYRQAAVFAFPSLYEGFGLPPLEAMACGTPVVASNASSIPEGVGDAGLLVDPLDVPALAAALDRALTDEALRDALRERGLSRAAEFTWERSARQWLALVRERF